MGKVINFMKKHSTLLTLALFVLFTFVMSSEVLAQGTTSAVDAGPFKAFLKRAAALFSQTRIAIYTVAAFAFVAYAWHAIQEGNVEWKKILYLIVGLVLLGVAGWTVTYLAGEQQDGLLKEYSQFKDIKADGWDGE